MQQSTLKRNLFPIVLITLGCLIFLAIVLYLFRAHLAIVGWVILGLLMIGAGVLGIVASKPKTKTRASAESTQSSPITSPGSSVTARKAKPGQQDAITFSKPVLIGGGVLLVSLVLLLLCNLGTALRSLLTVHETQIVDCAEVSRYTEDGWRFVSTYSYSVEDAVSGYVLYTNCVMEQEQYIWARDRRPPQDDASTDDASDTSFIDVLESTPYLEPTQTPFHQPVATQISLSSPSPGFAVSPLPTWTPPASAVSSSTDTLFPQGSD